MIWLTVVPSCRDKIRFPYYCNKIFLWLTQTNLQGLRINISEIIYFLDIIFLMLVSKGHTQPYDANADTNICKMCESEGL